MSTRTLAVDYGDRKLDIDVPASAVVADMIDMVVGRSQITFRTLELIMREAPTSGSGPWAEKAEYYKGEADLALQRALQIIGGEFETDDPPTDVISAEEAAQTTEQVGAGGWKMERA